LRLEQIAATSQHGNVRRVYFGGAAVRNARGQFLPGGSPGRPKGARNRLAARVFEDVLAHWNEPVTPGGNLTKGLEALETMYREKANEYVRAVLSLMPKELAIESVMADMSDDQLDELMVKIRDALLTGKAGEVEEEDADVVH
jgi:hypothetical protein